MKKKGLQKHNSEYLKMTKGVTATQAADFLESYRLLQGAKDVESILISLRVPSDLLETFKAKCEISGEKYQTQIKKLMRQFVEGNQV
jgi:uncharacterized protein (DUF4415 family)